MIKMSENVDFSEFITYRYQYRDNDVRDVICGRTGSGKSFMANQLARKLGKFNKVIYYSPKSLDNTITIPSLKLNDFLHYGAFFRKVLPKVNIKSNVIIDPALIVEYLAGLCLLLDYVVLIIDEANMILRDGIHLYQKFPNFAQFFFQGRHRHQGCIILSQSTKNIHKDILDQASNVYVYEHNERTRKVCQDHFGKNINFEKLKQKPYSFFFMNNKLAKWYYCNPISNTNKKRGEN